MRRERVIPAGHDLSGVLGAPVHDDRGGAVRRGGAVAELPEVVEAYTEPGRRASAKSKPALTWVIPYPARLRAG